MGKLNKKHAGRVAAIVAAMGVGVGAISFGISAFVKADSPINQDEIMVNYDDDYYCNAEALDIDNPVIQNIYENYEKSDLSLATKGNEIFYMINSSDIDKIDSVSSALYMQMDKSLDTKEDISLYLGNKNDCEYDTLTGKATSEFDGKWLMLNETQPLAMYNEEEENGVKSYYTPVYINDEEESTNLLVTVDSSDNVEVAGRVVCKDIEGNPLDEVQIEPLQDTDVLCPAYVNSDYSVVNVTNTVANASEIYNENSYEYGKEFDITYSMIPEDAYMYSMKTNYKDDLTTDDVEEDYGFFTRPIKVNISNGKIIEVIIEEEDTGSVDGVDYMDCFDFLKQVWKHKKVNTDQELYQAFEHKIDNVEKGYISTWNSLIINKALRTDKFDSLDADDQLTTNTLNGMCEKVSSTEDYLMLRKVSADYLTNVFGVKALNGETLSDEMVKEYSDEEKLQLEDNLQSIVGYKMVEKGFMSASILPYANIIFGRTVEIIIKVPAGSKYYVSHNVIESEAIFLTNTELTVESVKYNDDKGKYTIVATLSQNL